MPADGLIPIVAGISYTHRLGDERVSKSKDSLTTFCTAEGCRKPRRAKMLCSTHYNQLYRTPNPQAEFGCPMCGKTFTTDRSRAKRYAKLYCSRTCRDRGLTASNAQIEVWAPRPVLHMAIERIPRPTMHTQRTFVSGACRRCGQAFVDRMNNAQFCSPVCGKRWHRDERKERMGYVVPKRVRAEVYQRDKCTCQLCHTTVDMTLPAGHPLSHSLDHIVCVSWTTTPDHTARNLRLAHMVCNARRGNEAGGRRDVRRSA